MIGNVDLTEKQQQFLEQETKHFSANATNGNGYIPAYPTSRNGYYYLIIKQLDLNKSHISTIKRIAQRSRTQYWISVNNNRLELRFYATFDKLPKTMQ